ncbi:MAG: hypothetical protein HYX68_01100 [Planctomycetes bacterium]|nr:hypothetical protein [Planctomycetota bacterium]
MVSPELARAVADVDQPERVRKAAYFGLFEVRGIPIRSRPDPAAFRFPQGVDWEFVKTFG